MTAIKQDLLFIARAILAFIVVPFMALRYAFLLTVFLIICCLVLYWMGLPEFSLVLIVYFFGRAVNESLDKVYETQKVN